jgi:hypothetical protein
VKVSNLKIKDNLALSSAAQFNKGAEEVGEDLLNVILVDVAYEPNSGRVNLNEAALLFISLNKILMGNIVLTLTSSSFLEKDGSYLFLNLPAS